MFQLQEASLSSVSCQLRREIKEDAVHHHGRRENSGRAWVLFLGSDEIWCCYFHLVDTSACMVGIAAQEGISAGSMEVGTDEVGKAHGTLVGTLLEVDGRAPCTDGDGDVDADAGVDVNADADVGGETSLLSLKESEIQTTFFIAESSIGRTFSHANNPPITKDSY